MELIPPNYKFGGGGEGLAVAGFWKTVMHGRAMTPDEVAAWEQTRQRGRWRFVLANWLPRGLALGLAVGVYREYRAGEWDAVEANWPSVLVTAAVVGVLFGAWVGLNMWSMSEAKYRESGRA